MAKSTIKYVCSNCGYTCTKWLGRCPDCGNWNTLQEEMVVPAKNTFSAPLDPSFIKVLSDIPSLSNQRVKTEIEELDRVLGGGIVKGSVVLVGGEPGIGKSTLFLQAAHSLAKAEKTLYISAEESGEQVKLRAERLGISSSSILFFSETKVEVILSAVEQEKPKFLIVDSIQTIHSEHSPSAPGSVSQVRECAQILTQYAKKNGISVFIIGHVTKDGALAGPRVLEHIVDTVLYFEGERNTSLRILRAVKNRFGSTNEIGVFEMQDIGMKEVKNPSAAMLSSREKDISGACVFCAIEGTRPLLLEVEALVSETAFGTPRRLSTGIDYNRVSLVTAVLEKKVGLKLYNQDIFVNVSGGMRLMEPAADLAVAASIVSAFRNRPIPYGTAIFGEIGLTGEIRRTSFADRRVHEIERMGFSRVILPEVSMTGLKDCSVPLLGAKHIGEALSKLF